MKSPELWWFVALGNGKFEYRFSTLEKLVDEFNDLKISNYTVVHPDNTMYSKELRKYNKKYIKYIERSYVKQLEYLFKDLKAPKELLANADSTGAFSRHQNLLLDNTLLNNDN